MQRSSHSVSTLLWSSAAVRCCASFDKRGAAVGPQDDPQSYTVQTMILNLPAHPHKPIVVYASHQGLLQPCTFSLLSKKAQYDPVLASFLDSAFSGLQQELFAVHANIVAHDIEAGLPDNPATLEDLATSENHPAFNNCKIALTTIVHVATAISSRDDYRRAMSRDFPAIWDPESALAIHLLQRVDVSDSLQVLRHGLEAVKLACWLDYYLGQKGDSGQCERILVSGDEQALTVIENLASHACMPLQKTMRGLALGLSDTLQLQNILDKAGGQTSVGVSKLTTLPLQVLTESQGKELLECIRARLVARGIQYPLDYCGPFLQTGGSDQQSSGSGQLLNAMAEKLNDGQALEHVQRTIDAVKQLSQRAVLYGSQVSILVFGHPTADICSKQVTTRLSSVGLKPVVVHLRNFLYVKDATRFGDEPVRLSKVEGNPCQQVAIIGMSCRLPGANDAAELWNLLQRGDDMCGKIPESLYDYKEYHSNSYRDRNVMRVTTGNFISAPRLFDQSLLASQGVTAEDCRQMDPQQRLALLTAFETLQQGGYGFSSDKPPSNASEWSSHVAYCTDDYREHLSHDIRPGFVANTHRAHLVSRINETFGFQGEACTYDTACSSALVAIEAACNSLLSGQSSSVITGGINILTQPQITIGLDRGFFLSAASQCMTLDDAGAGYSRADAVSLMLLKRLPDALRDGDPILALISSASTNHSGESFSITHPHGPTQQRLYRSGMLASNALPEDFSYIEMHGTGTQSGDLEEVTGIIETFGQGKRERKQPLVLGSVKANIGHSEAASGSSSIIKTLKVYENGLVPRHIGIRTKLNSKLPKLEGVHVPMEATPLSEVNRSFTLVDNFSAAGGNSSIVLDKGARYSAMRAQLQKTIQACEPDHSHLLFVTAASPFSLDAKRRRLITFLDEHPSVSVKEFCSVVSLSDPMLPFRLLATPSNNAEVKACLSGQESVTCLRHEDVVPRIGIAFSGQGSQYLDMGREFYERSPGFRAHIDRCSIVASSQQLPDFIDVIRPSATSLASSLHDRTADSFSPVQFQLALVAIEIGLASMLTDWGISPVAVVGHSLGEYAALWMAEVLSLRDVLSLVGSRAMLMMELCEPHASSMLAIRADSSKVHSLLKVSDSLEIACLNSPTDTVVAGRTTDIEKLRVTCETSNPRIKAMAIPVPYAFHSQFVEVLKAPYAEILRKYRFQSPKLPLASNVLGAVIPPGSQTIDQEYLVRHLRQPVRFFEGIVQLQEREEVNHWIDLGPHPTCIPMLKGCYVDQSEQPFFTASLRRGSSSWQAILDLVTSLASQNIKCDWTRVWSDLGLSSPNSNLAPKLPLYAFDLEEYWIPFQDRGLRDHLVEQRPSVASPLAITVQRPKKKKNGLKERKDNARSFSKPAHALLTCCVELTLSPPSAKLLSKVNQPPFREFIRGHVILGVPLAPATVFVELAQEVGHYWWQAGKSHGQTRNEGPVVMEVLDLSMVASLYLDKENYDQMVEITMQGDPGSHDGCIVQFFSHSEEPRQQHQFGSCRVRALTLPAVQEEWSKLSHLIQAAAKGVKAEPASVLKLDTIYSEFEAIVLYLGGFRGMNQIWMTATGGEAVSLVKYSAEALAGRYLCSPMLLDSLGGLTGFISNVAFAEDKWIYMADAIGRVVTMPELSELHPGTDTKIHVYARMEQQNDLSTGSAYFFKEDGVLMGMMEGIVFKRIRRDVLQRLVQMSSKAFAEESKRASKLPSAEVQSHANDDQSVKPVTFSAAAKFNKPGRTDNSVDMMQAYVLPHHLGGPALKVLGEQPTLILFPDGTGLARSYPRLDRASMSIYGFESPYLGQSKDWSRGVPQLIERYVRMLLNVQPQGPYRLGGWSIGGIIALQVARHLLSAGHQVLFLVLIDTPYASQIRPLPSRTLDDMVARIGSSTVREHFRSCALSLPNYRCLSFRPEDKKPDVIAIINAMDQTKMEGLMASQSEWLAFWSDASRVVYKEVEGDHWSCVEPAMREVDRMIK